MRKSSKLSNLVISNKNSSPTASSSFFRTIFKCRNNTILSPQLQASFKSVDQIKSTYKKEDQNANSSMNRTELAESNIKDCGRSIKIKMEDSFVGRQQSKQKQLIDMKQSRLSSRSNISNCIGGIQQCKPISVDQIQKRVESLLSSKLEKICTFKEGVGLTSWQYLKQHNCLQPELQEIITRLKSGQQNQQGLSQICLKLQMLEKMIASQAIQSQLLKDRYFGYKNQRSNLSSHHNKKLLTSNSLMNDLRVNLQKFKLKSKGEFLNNCTSNREAYSKPGREFYVNEHYKHPAYTPNRQILQRSLYSSDFLHYGVVPTFNNRPADQQSLPSHVPLAVKASKYQQQFKDKSNLTKTINFKQLDCYQDKFKNPDISFMNSCKKKMMRSMESLKKRKHVQKQNLVGQSKLNKMLSQSTFKDFYKSQQKRSYLAYSSSQSELLKSKPKDSQLQKLKELKHRLRKSYLD